MRETVLVVAAPELVRHRLKASLRTAERDIFLAETAREAFVAAAQVEPTVVLVSMELPDLPGIRALQAFRERMPQVPIIAVSEAPSVEAAVDALRNGASDYLELDAPRARLIEATARALQARSATKLVERVNQDRDGLGDLVTQSPRMLNVFDQVRAVAVTDATVLILGETGTGKELVSRAIHERSRRKDKPFISVNCGAFTESLLESELFGHERGSFTGAVGRREGLFEMADGGSLFLDELGETTLNVQVNLLRVLEEMTFRRVGGRETVRVNVRIIAATNVDLSSAVDDNRFRRDLYYRLNVFPIRLPPLRERREDIPLLLRHFLDEIAHNYGLEPPSLSADAIQSILAYPWPGNVRQLRAMCERWVITHAGRKLERDDLPHDMSGHRDGPAQGSLDIDEQQPLKDNLDRLVRQVERAYLFKLLQRHRGHLAHTADAAGITRRTLYTKMKEYGLDASEFRPAPAAPPQRSTG